MPESQKIDYRNPTEHQPRPTTWPEIVAVVFVVIGVVVVLSVLAWLALSFVAGGFDRS